MNLTKKVQFGRSMVEIIGVLAIVGILSIGAITTYSNVMEKINSDKLIEDAAFSLKKLHMVYSGKKSYQNIEKQVFDFNLIQGIDKIDGTERKMLHRLNGEVIVKSIAYDRGYVVIYNGLNNSSCIALASLNLGRQSSGLQFMVVSPTGVIPPHGFPKDLDWGEFEANDLPLSPAKAAEYCVCNKFFKCGIAWFFK